MVRIPLHVALDGPRLPRAGPETPSAGVLPGRLPAPLRPGPFLPGFPAHRRCQVLRADPRAVRGDCGFSRRGLPHGSLCPEERTSSLHAISLNGVGTCATDPAIRAPSPTPAGTCPGTVSYTHLRAHETRHDL